MKVQNYDEREVGLVLWGRRKEKDRRGEKSESSQEVSFSLKRSRVRARATSASGFLILVELVILTSYHRYLIFRSCGGGGRRQAADFW
jgi:hypothetical protein